MLDQLASKEGRGTELISLYIPPDRQLHEVIANLKEENNTASNIKSRTTRKNVQDAIEKVIQRVKLFKKPTPTGLVIFCGALPQNGVGTEKMETYVLAPPETINVYFYRCDSRFHLEPLQEILRERETYGILVIDSTEAVLAALRGRRVETLKQFTSGIPGKHRAGGQSARRFERIREAEVNGYFKRVGSHVNELLGQIGDLKGLIIGGPGPTKYDFRDGEYLNYMLKQKIVATVDTSYVGDGGVDEVVEKSPTILRGVRYMEEKVAVQRFLRELGQETGLAVYGVSEVRKHLEENHIDTLLLSEKLNLVHTVIRCGQCSNVEEKLLTPLEFSKLRQNIQDEKCSSCSNKTLSVAESKDLADELIEIAEKTGANIEIVSTETEEGVMLNKSFLGVAAILKFRPGN